MGDLHSIAYSSSSCSSLGLGGWDFHDLQVFNTDISPFMENTPPFLSNLDSDFSSGYLQDALFKFSSKRRRLLLFDDNENYQTKDSNDSMKNLWSSNMDQHFSEDCDSFSQLTKCDSFSDVKRTEEEAISASHETYNYSSASSHDQKVNTQHSNSDKEVLRQYPTHPSFPTGGSDQKRSKKRMTAKVVYPFGVVKPGGQEGDVTLNDINERILMRPTRPVRHPVGDFACRPTVSPTGPGLSGKTVVALTKIHTQGRGTITIIRTRG
ncbi:protein XRI1-like [Nicotiana tomentosiformis]|uniref:protein XRI1-like n=1 Tax=Nicotiana tomentosiformis TaxID=4098 RepID=UPI00051C7DB4|nr:protein XRI1-like isoform X2 [Nicotiana tomentosiformis]